MNRTPRHGVTVVELVIVVLLSAVAFGVAYQAIHLLLRSEQSTDKGSSRAIMEARMMEVLLKDVRSAKDITTIVADKEYRILRHVLDASGRAVEREVVWKLGATGRKVVRQEAGTGAQEFDFTSLLDLDSPPIQLRIRRVADGVFDPANPTP